MMGRVGQLQFCETDRTGDVLGRDLIGTRGTESENAHAYFVVASKIYADVKLNRSSSQFLYATLSRRPIALHIVPLGDHKISNPSTISLLNLGTGNRTRWGCRHPWHVQKSTEMGPASLEKRRARSRGHSRAVPSTDEGPTRRREIRGQSTR